MDMPPHDALLLMWITFTGVAALGVSITLIWAVRSRQFSNQDRSRYLPLTSGIPKEEANRSSEDATKRGKNVSA